ncbi:MAG: excinuclease ABC subunit UvrA [Clostridia bacterium]|nr:excinuclease ABC subunit UvrA [Clostridia bacterium]
MNDKIIVKGAKENNLKNVDIEIPRNSLTVFTGLSGSGKTSLAFDTIYAEGQRRYVESLSSYARQFLGMMEKPDVESIDGLSPAIAIDQKTTSKNPRSTIGTVTEIYDYLRLLYARIGIPHCPVCGKKITMQTIDQIVDQILEFEQGTKIIIMAPVIRGKKGEHARIIEQAIKNGYTRVRIDGVMCDLSEELPEIEKSKAHNIEIVVDRLIISEDIHKRVTESVELAMKEASNLVLVDVLDKEEILFSGNYSCPDCGISMEELSPRMFSFNTPFGACPTCTGVGELLKIDPDRIIPDKNKKISDPTLIKAWGGNSEDSATLMYIRGLCAHYGVELDTKYSKLPENFKNVLLYGSGEEKIKFSYASRTFTRNFEAPFEGVCNILERRHSETRSTLQKEIYAGFMNNIPCPTCNGARLKDTVLSVKVGKLNIYELTKMPITEIKEYITNLNLTKHQMFIAEQIIKEINTRLQFLIDVGLDYLTLARSASTLSGGESQRIRLATQIGSGLTGVLYILDEPSIGLHQRDNGKLLASLMKMRDLGNTLIVVEHDEDTMRAADYLVDIGPKAGMHGGQVVAHGTAEQVMECENSITGKYLSGKLKIEVPKKRREGNGNKIKIIKAAENNLKDIDVEIPLGTMTCITGVSGSGKSSLINEVLYKAASAKANHARHKAGKHKKIEGLENIDKVINIDQSPIGRTPRSNAATYTGIFDLIRELFAMTSEAKLRGYQKGRFSFNVAGGRCEACQGDGIIQIEMHFLPDIYVPCEVCKGKRYNRETLEVKYKGKSINDVLNMTVEEALEFFKNVTKIKNKLQTLYDVGLGYIKIGQSSTTLSGGEAQRIKLATELSKHSTGKTLYILDEPTTGLHSHDVSNLIHIINRLVDNGNSAVIIEHNLDVIKCADYIIDLGPEGGEKGGTILAEGMPEEIVKVKTSYTGQFLKKILEKE